MCICFYRNRDHTGWDFFTWWDDINEPKEWQKYLVYVSGREDNFPVPSLVANTWHKRKTQCTRLPLLQGSGRLLTRYMYSALLHFVEAAFLPLNMALQNLKRNINILRKWITLFPHFPLTHYMCYISTTECLCTCSIHMLVLRRHSLKLVQHWLSPVAAAAK